MRTIALLIVAAGCGGGGLTPIDLSERDMALPLQNQSGSDLAMAAAPDDLSMPVVNQNSCSTYTQSSIMAMRQPAKSGCFELDNVITLAATYVGASTTSVTIHVQDDNGGDYSAITLSCSMSATTSHPCAAFSTAKNILVGRKVTVQGTYLKGSAQKGGYESFAIDNITDNGSGTAPSPAPLMEADLERGAVTSSGGKPMAAYWFQVVSANLADKLVMFDWSVPEFKRTTSSSCPQYYGFGMIPTSANATAGSACSGTTQPAGQSAVNAKEVLIGTDYFTGFTYTTDCACNTHADPSPTAGQGTSGAIKAILDYDVATGQSTGYQYLSPLSNTDFTIH